MNKQINDLLGIIELIDQEIKDLLQLSDNDIVAALKSKSTRYLYAYSTRGTPDSIKLERRLSGGHNTNKVCCTIKPRAKCPLCGFCICSDCLERQRGEQSTLYGPDHFASYVHRVYDANCKGNLSWQ